MKPLLTYLLLIMILPVVTHAQARYSGRKTVAAGGVQFDIHGSGVCFGQNPIFLVPTDTLGNVSFTGMINNIKVMGRFAPYAPYTNNHDTMEVQDPITGKYIEMYDSSFYARKHGVWTYYYQDGNIYNEYYDMGELIRMDSLKGDFTIGNRKITIVDSMARIRSMIDLYFKKGVR